MDQHVKLQKYSIKMLNDCKIVIKPEDKFKVIEQISIYLDALVFNIVSIMCLISTINDSKEITKKTLDVSKQYIETECKFYYTQLSTSKSGKMTGGLGSSAILGAQEGMYSVDNTGSDILHLDFENGEARPQIGGKLKDNGLIYKCIGFILKYHGIKASKDIKNEICKIIHTHMECLFKNLARDNKKLTLSKLNRVVKSNNILRPLK